MSEIKVEETDISTGCYFINVLHRIIWNSFMIGGATWLIIEHNWSLGTYLFALLLMYSPAKNENKKNEKN